MPVEAKRASYWATVAVILGLLAGVGVNNAREYPLYGGYDEAEHQAYADLLIHHGAIPGTGEYYTPPGFYAVAGLGTLIAEKLGAAEPWKVGRGLNVLWAVATAVLVLLIARLLFPGRLALHLASLGFAAFIPVLMKTAAMFHPETFSLFVSTLALYLAARLLVRRSFRFWPALLLGTTLGAAQLVRAFTIWTFAAVVITLLAAAAAGYAPRQRIFVTVGVVIAGTALVAGPWYLRQAIKYSNPVFDRPTANQPLWSRRPLSFYTALGLPEVFSEPIRPHYTNNFLPTLYSDTWGDYFGNYAWGSPTPPSPDINRQLTLQSEIGVVPTALALGGWVALLALSLRRRNLRQHPAYALVALLPLLGLLGFLYFTVGYPTPDGDVIKAAFMLTTVPGWAIAFGFAVGALARGLFAQLGLAIFLVGCLVMNFGFLIFHSPLAGVF